MSTQTHGDVLALQEIVSQVEQATATFNAWQGIERSPAALRHILPKSDLVTETRLSPRGRTLTGRHRDSGRGHAPRKRSDDVESERRDENENNCKENGTSRAEQVRRAV